VTSAALKALRRLQKVEPPLNKRGKRDHGLAEKAGGAGGNVLERSKTSPLSWREELSTWSEDLRDWWEERAALMEYDGGLPREEAEFQAFESVRNVANVRNGRNGNV